MKIVKNIIVLTVITVISGFLLGFVYDLTKEPIAASEVAAKQAAYKSVYPEAESFEVAADFDADASKALLSSHGYDHETIDEVFYAQDAGGNVIGFVYVVSTNQSYDGNLTLSMGVKNDGTINGIELLSITDTPGLGMNATKDEFKSQFKGMNATQISYTKTGKSADYEIDAISGATITTNAVTSAVNAGLAYYYNSGNGQIAEVSNEQ